MRILHTSDWHLGKRSRRLDRSGDLKRVVEQVFALCDQHAVDVLLIAGDLFDRPGSSDDIQEAVRHLKDTASAFLRGGGTILATLGNHDKEILCTIFRHFLALADPSETRRGLRWAAGRFHLATNPTFLRLADRAGYEVQFVIMPYPTPGRYFDDSDPETSYQNADQKRLKLREQFVRELGDMRRNKSFDTHMPTVLTAHIGLSGARLSNAHELTEDDGLNCHPDTLGADWDYVALGDVHKPQTIGGREHVRYSGSIDRMDIDEREDEKGAVLVEIGPRGLAEKPMVLPLDATPFLDLTIDEPSVGLTDLERTRGGTDPRTIVRCRVTCRRGHDDTDEIRRRLDALFPRLYELTFRGEEDPIATNSPGADGAHRRGFREGILEYLRSRLVNQANAADVLAEAESLLEEAQA